MASLFKRVKATSEVNLDCDVVVVGTGSGGSAAACTFAEAGYDVVMVEEGGYYTREQFDQDVLGSMSRLYRESGGTVIAGVPPIFFGEGRCVGGSAVLNAGISWRTPERVLKQWYFETGIGDFSAERLAPFFEQVEKDIHVSHHNPGIIGRDSETLRRGAEKMGYRYEELSRNIRDCQGASACVYGCPTGAKQSPIESYVPRALKAGARLVANCRVDRVVVQNGRASGIEGRFVDHPAMPDGPKVKIHAAVVIVACGAIQTPRLLLMSKLGNPAHVGRHLSLHPNAKIVAKFDEKVEGWKGSIQGYHVREFMEEGFTFGTSFPPPPMFAAGLPTYGDKALEMFEALPHLAFHGVLVEDTSRGQVRLGPGNGAIATYMLNDVDFEKTKRSLAVLAEMLFAAGAKKLWLPFEQLGSITSPDEIGKIYSTGLQKGATEYMTVHAMGTAKMGRDPQHSVVDEWCQMHGVENLFVNDASVFPGPIACNPMESIMAFSLRTSQHIIEARQHLFSQGRMKMAA